MGLSSTTYSTDPTAFAIDGVRAGDAAEMESRAEALLAASATPTNVTDLMLAGVEEGPAWQACFTFGAAALSLARTDVRVAAAVGSSGEEAVLLLKERIAAINAEVSPGLVVEAVGKVEIAGNGVGENVMALAMLGLAAP